MTSNATTVDMYLQEQTEDRARALETIRRLICESAPDASELMKYGHPHWALDGQPLFALASQKHFMALYIVHHDLVKEALPTLGKVNAGKSCIRFKVLESLDLAAVGRLLKSAYERSLELAARN